MSDEGTGSGWQPLSRPDLTRRKGGTAHIPDADGSRRVDLDGPSRVVSPFVRLARTHAFHAAGEASVFVTLAGTLLSIDPNDARSRILLALVLTMAPFAVVGPLIGPALDRIRGGRKAMIALSLVLRAALMILLIRNVDTNWFFPIAFIWLVLGKTYSVAKAATVPTTVEDEDELVEKNSRLAILSAVAGAAGVIPAAVLYRFFGSTPTLWWAAIVYIGGVVVALKLPRVIVDDPETPDDDLDIRSAGVRLASFVMATLRGIVGFVFFLLLFEFVRSELPDLSGVGTAAGASVKHALGFELLEDPGLPWYKAAIPFAMWGLGGFAGNVIAPWLRKKFSEEKMLVGAVLTVALSAIAAVWAGGLSGAALVALIVGSSASAAKLAFDSLVQRDAPGANHGAAFGRFETSFQIAWVIGSLLAVIVRFPLRAGFLMIAFATIGIGVFIMRQGARSGLSFGGAPNLGGRFGRGSGNESDESEQNGGAAVSTAPPVEYSDAQAAAASAHAAAPVTQVIPKVRADQAPPAPPYEAPRTQEAATSSYSGADPYAEAFTDQTVSPPDWASAVFGDESAGDDLAPPSWLNEPEPFVSPNPTPPFGTERVDPQR